MRILCVGWGFSPFRAGGSLRYAEAVMEGMAARGHAVGYFCAGRYGLLGGRKPYLRAWSRRGVEILEVRNSPVVPGWGLGTKNPEQEAACPPLADLLSAAVRRFRPDVVHVHELNALSADLVGILKEAGLPVACSLHDFGPVCPTFHLFKHDRTVCVDYGEGRDCVLCSTEAPPDTAAFRFALGVHSLLGERRQALFGRMSSGLKSAFRRRAARGRGSAETDRRAAGFVLRRSRFVAGLSSADLLLPVSRRVAALYADYGVKGPPVRVLHPVLPHHDAIRPAARPGSRSGKIRFGYVGLLIPAKGIETLLTAWPRVARRSEAELVVYGACNPAYRAELEKRFPEGMSGYRGPFDAGSLPSVLSGIDVGVFPSVCEETYGLVAVEFQHAGIPVVASRTGGIPEIVRDGENGILVTPGDAGNLAAAMDRLAGAPELRDDLARRAFRAPCFREAVDVLEGIYRGLADGSGKKGPETGMA